MHSPSKEQDKNIPLHVFTKTGQPCLSGPVLLGYAHVVFASDS